MVDVSESGCVIYTTLRIYEDAIIHLHVLHHHDTCKKPMIQFSSNHRCIRVNSFSMLYGRNTGHTIDTSTLQSYRHEIIKSSTRIHEPRWAFYRYNNNISYDIDMIIYLTSSEVLLRVTIFLLTAIIIHHNIPGERGGPMFTNALRFRQLFSIPAVLTFMVNRC